MTPEIVAAAVAEALDGFVLLDESRRFVYANAAACTLLGRPWAELVGTDYLDYVAPSDRATQTANYRRTMAGETGRRHVDLLKPDGSVREVQYTTLSCSADGRRISGAVLRDLTGTRAAARRAAALGSVADSASGSAPLPDVLVTFARSAVEGTEAIAAAVLLLAADGAVEAAGTEATPDGFDRALRAVSDTAAGRSALRQLVPGRVHVVADALPSLRAVSGLEPLAEALADLAGWGSSVHAPVLYGEQLVGAVLAFFPETLVTAAAEEVAFLTTLADQAALVVAHSQLLALAAHAASADERARLARELHDSVSQDLFTIVVHARAAARRADEDPGIAQAALGTILERAEAALAELRAVLVDLHPDGVRIQGLVGALQRYAASVALRHGLEVDVDGPMQLDELPDTHREGLYRLAREAVHNAVKHARPTRVEVTVAVGTTVERPIATVEVRDDGCGFDADAQPGGLGLASMRERAQALDGVLEVQSRAGLGTTVRATVPLPRRG